MSTPYLTASNDSILKELFKILLMEGMYVIGWTLSPENPGTYVWVRVQSQHTINDRRWLRICFCDTCGEMMLDHSFDVSFADGYASSSNVIETFPHILPWVVEMLREEHEHSLPK